MPVLGKNGTRARSGCLKTSGKEITQSHPRSQRTGFQPSPVSAVVMGCARGCVAVASRTAGARRAWSNASRMQLRRTCADQFVTSAESGIRPFPPLLAISQGGWRPRNAPAVHIQRQFGCMLCAPWPLFVPNCRRSIVSLSPTLGGNDGLNNAGGVNGVSRGRRDGGRLRAFVHQNGGSSALFLHGIGAFRSHFCPCSGVGIVDSERSSVTHSLGASETLDPRHPVLSPRGLSRRHREKEKSWLSADREPPDP